MTKEPSQPPKAVNIIRPNTNYGLLSTSSSSGSSNGGNGSTSVYTQKRNGSIHSLLSSSSSSNNNNRKPREKPVLNLYHPPTRKSTQDEYHRTGSITSHSRPPIEIYKPQQQPQPQPQLQQRITKSFTANNNENLSTTNNYIKSSHRSVLGRINTPVAATTAIIHPIELPDPTIIETIENDDNLTNITNHDDAYDEEEEKDDDDLEEDEEEEPVINEARVNRKIADLELSIDSLLSVNAMLETTVRKQASQLSQMKNKMLSGESIEIEDLILGDDNNDNDNDNDNDDQSEDEKDWDQDMIFQRLRKVTEYMIEQGQKSIDFEYKILGRVLSNYAHPEDEEEEEEEEVKVSSLTIQQPVASSSSTIPLQKQSSTINNTTPTITITTTPHVNTTTRISKLTKRRVN